MRLRFLFEKPGRQNPVINYSYSGRVVEFIGKYALIILIVLIVFVIAFIDASFLSIANFRAILVQSATRIILACGIGSIIVLGSIDLALGRTVGLAAVISASLLQAADFSMRAFGFSPLPLIIVIFIVMIVTGILTAAQSLIISKWGAAPFIVSLGASQIIFGLCFIYYNIIGSTPISNFDSTFVEFSQGATYLFAGIGIPNLILYAAFVCILTWFIWNKTVLGKHMFAIGGNREAAKYSGVNLSKTVFFIYFIAGLMYGLGGTLEAGRTGSAVPITGAGYELDAIAACVVGGVSLRGGVGSVKGIVLGVILFQFIAYGLIFIGIPPDIQFIIRGLILVFAITIDAFKYQRKS